MVSNNNSLQFKQNLEKINEQERIGNAEIENARREK